MKNSNPFLGVPSVSSNTLIKPNTEKRKTDREGLWWHGGVEMRVGTADGVVIFFPYRINNLGADIMKI